MGWTYEQYMSQPTWFIAELIRQKNRETYELKKVHARR